jgi:hypothetical protein
MKTSVSLIKHQAIVTYGGVEMQLHTALTLALDSGVSFTLRYFTSQ